MKFTTVVVALMATPAVAWQGGYLSQINDAATSTPTSFTPSGGANYLDFIESAAGGYETPVVQQQVYETPVQVNSPAFSLSEMLDENTVAAPAGDYLNHMSGGNEMKESSFMPSGSFVPSASGPTGYLDNFVPSPAQSYPAFSFSEMLDDSTVAASAGDYLRELKVSSSLGGSGPVGYLDNLRIQASRNAPKNLAGYLDTLSVHASTVTGSIGPNTYLDNLAGAASVTAKVEATTEVTMADNEPVLAAINELSVNMNRNHGQFLEILQDINGAVQTLISKADQASTSSYAAPTSYYAPAAETTELVTALEGSASPSSGSYLDQMNGAAPTYVPSSYAPTKNTVGRSSGGGVGSYLDRI